MSEISQPLAESEHAASVVAQADPQVVRFSDFHRLAGGWTYSSSLVGNATGDYVPLAEYQLVVSERDNLAAFKKYVHRRLDEIGIPSDPESPRKAEGCRIGARIDYFDAELAKCREQLAAVTKERDAIRMPYNAGITCEVCKWTNNGCLMVGEPAKWTCHGCLDRGIKERDSLKQQLADARPKVIVGGEAEPQPGHLVVCFMGKSFNWAGMTWHKNTSAGFTYLDYGIPKFPDQPVAQPCTSSASSPDSSAVDSSVASAADLGVQISGSQECEPEQAEWEASSDDLSGAIGWEPQPVKPFDRTHEKLRELSGRVARGSHLDELMVILLERESAK